MNLMGVLTRQARKQGENLSSGLPLLTNQPICRPADLSACRYTDITTYLLENWQAKRDNIFSLFVRISSLTPHSVSSPHRMS